MQFSAAAGQIDANRFVAIGCSGPCPLRCCPVINQRGSTGHLGPTAPAYPPTAPQGGLFWATIKACRCTGRQTGTRLLLLQAPGALSCNAAHAAGSVNGSHVRPASTTHQTHLLVETLNACHCSSMSTSSLPVRRHCRAHLHHDTIASHPVDILQQPARLHTRTPGQYSTRAIHYLPLSLFRPDSVHAKASDLQLHTQIKASPTWTDGFPLDSWTLPAQQP